MKQENYSMIIMVIIRMKNMITMMTKIHITTMMMTIMMIITMKIMKITMMMNPGTHYLWIYSV